MSNGGLKVFVGNEWVGMVVFFILLVWVFGRVLVFVNDFIVGSGQLVG